MYSRKFGLRLRGKCGNLRALRRAAETNTRAACARQTVNSPLSICYLFWLGAFAQRFFVSPESSINQTQGEKSTNISRARNARAAAAAAERSSFLADELSAGSLGCGNDLVEALITAQRIPAWIEAEIAVCRHYEPAEHSWDCRNFFELLERAVALARPRVHQRQSGNVDRTIDPVLGNRQELNGPSCLADRIVFSAKPGIKCRNFRQVARMLGLIAEFCFNLFARGYKRRQGFLLITARTRNLSLSPTRSLPTEGEIRPLRRSCGNHPIRRVVIPQVKGCRESDVPYPEARTVVQGHLL